MLRAAWTGPRVLTRLLLAAVVALGVGGVLVAPASAHVSLTGTTPADGASVDAAPTSVELTYSDALLEVGNVVFVAGPGGPLVLDPLQVSDRTLLQPLPADLPPGEYTVQWRAASGDGHPIEGTFAFTSTAAAPSAAPTTTAAPTSAAPTTTAPTTTSATTASATTDPAATTSAPVDPTAPGGASGLPVWAGVGVALLAAVGVALVVLRRGRRPGVHE